MREVAVEKVKCDECDADVIIVGRNTLHYEPVNSKAADAVAKYKIPFVCSLCGSINIPYRPLRAVVFLWIPPLPEKVGLIHIPDYEGRQGNARDLLREPTAVIMAFGPGAYTPEGKFIPSSGIEVGDLILYNKSVPWSQFMTDPTGKEHKIVLCSYADLIGVVKEAGVTKNVKVTRKVKRAKK